MYRLILGLLAVLGCVPAMAQTFPSPTFLNLHVNGSTTLNGGVLGGSYTGGTFVGSALSGGTINSTPVGNVTPSTGSFSTLGASGAASLLGGGTHTGTFTGGTFSGITLGGSITATGATITGGTISATDLGLGVVTATGSPTSRALAARAADILNALDGTGAIAGMKCDGVTDDTASFQALITKAQAAFGTVAKEIDLPSGVCNITGVNISGPITIKGQGRWNTIINLVSGSTAPAITVSISTTNWTGNAGFPEVLFRDFQITSPNRTDVPGLGVAHGIAFLKPASPRTTVLYLNNVLIVGVPGDGFYALGFAGPLEANNSSIAYPGGYGLTAISTSDWTWQGGEIFGAITSNINLSGSSNMRFNQLNTFVSVDSDINIFNTQVLFDNCMIDETATNNVAVNNVNGSRVDFTNSTIRWPSTAADATYSGIVMAATNTGNVYLTAVTFPTPASSPNVNKAAFNIKFAGGNTGVVVVNNVNFDLGPVSTAGVTNAVGSIVTNVVSTLNVTGVLNGTTEKLVSATQFSGLQINNGVNDTLDLIGSTASNDGGLIKLNMAGAQIVQLWADGPNYINKALSVGTTAGAPTSGMLVNGPIVVGGTKFTTSGCGISATAGSGTAGTYTSGTTGTCTAVITLNGATGSTAPNGWNCSAADWTTPGDVQTQTGGTTTTATIAGPTVTGDVIHFACQAY